MDETAARKLAAEWIAAWNAHDLDAILDHYDEAIEFRSPFVARLTGEPSGVVRGRDALRAYFAAALVTYPDLRFELHGVTAGVDSLVIYYTSVNGLQAMEELTVGPHGRVTAVRAHYAAPRDPAA